MTTPSIVPSRLVPKITLLFAFLVLLPWGAITFATLTAGHQHLAPESMLRLQAVGRTLVEPIERALGYGIAPADLRGMEEFLDQELATTAGLQSIILRGLDGQVIHMREARRVPGGAPLRPGRSVSLGINMDDEQVATLELTEQASETDRLYDLALRNLAIALILALLIGYETIRVLASVLLLAPLRLGERLIAAIGAGDLRNVAGRAAMGGEIGALLSACNRVARRILDRCEDILFYAREVRVGLPPAEAARVDQIAQGVARRFRTSPTVQEMQPAVARPLRDFAGFVATTALVLQLPAFLLLAQPLGSTMPTVALGIGAVLVLLLGPVWTALGGLLGARLVVFGALLLALIPLLPWRDLPNDVAVALRVMGFVCVLSVLRLPLARSSDTEEEDEGDALRWNVHGLATGFGLMALHSGPVSDYWPALLFILAFALMMLSQTAPARATPSRRPRIGWPAPSPSVLAAMVLLLLGYAYAIGRGAELLAGSDDRWTQPVLFAAGIAGGLGLIRLLPRDPARALPIATIGLVLVPLLVVPMIAWGGGRLLPHGLAAGAIIGLAELAAVRLLLGVPGAGVLVRMTTWIGALLGLLFVSGWLPPAMALDLGLTPLLAAGAAGLTWACITLAERGRARNG